jgi:hypothetical protein
VLKPSQTGRQSRREVNACYSCGNMPVDLKTAAVPQRLSLLGVTRWLAELHKHMLALRAADGLNPACRAPPFPQV